LRKGLKWKTFLSFFGEESLERKARPASWRETPTKKADRLIIFKIGFDNIKIIA